MTQILLICYSSFGLKSLGNSVNNDCGFFYQGWEMRDR